MDSLLSESAMIAVLAVATVVIVLFIFLVKIHPALGTLGGMALAIFFSVATPGELSVKISVILFIIIAGGGYMFLQMQVPTSRVRFYRVRDLPVRQLKLFD